MEWTNFSPVSSCQLRASWLGMEDHVDFPLSGLRLHVACTWADPVHKAVASVISYVCLYSCAEKHCFLGVKHSPRLLQAFVSSAPQLPVSQHAVKWRSKEIFFKAFCTKNIQDCALPSIMRSEERRQNNKWRWIPLKTGKEPPSSSLGNGKPLSHSSAFWEAPSNPSRSLWGFFTGLADDPTYVPSSRGLLCPGLKMLCGFPLSIIPGTLD